MQHSTTKYRTTESHNKVATFSPLRKIYVYFIIWYDVLHSNKKTKRNLNNATKNSSEYTTSNNQSVNEELRYVMGESIYLYRRVTKEQGYLSNDQYVLSNTKKKKECRL